ncbi:hypothetical protein BC832DRAFT_203927 [Gaertneriomyces semiglobifer]|nr:hypothetical protein BC832DRAFT_203927 [Gaertneriomyces semiglobifer]
MSTISKRSATTTTTGGSTTPSNKRLRRSTNLSDAAIRALVHDEFWSTRHHTEWTPISFARHMATNCAGSSSMPARSVHSAWMSELRCLEQHLSVASAKKSVLRFLSNAGRESAAECINKFWDSNEALSIRCASSEADRSAEMMMAARLTEKAAVLKQAAQNTIRKHVNSDNAAVEKESDAGTTHEEFMCWDGLSANPEGEHIQNWTNSISPEVGVVGPAESEHTTLHPDTNLSDVEGENTFDFPDPILQKGGERSQPDAASDTNANDHFEWVLSTGKNVLMAVEEARDRMKGTDAPNMLLWWGILDCTGADPAMKG